MDTTKFSAMALPLSQAASLAVLPTAPGGGQRPSTGEKQRTFAR